MAKKIRGPVIIEPLSAPKQEIITMPEVTAPPIPANSGIRSATVAAMSGAPAISGRGTA
jgi:hypothetical protein